MKHLVDHDKPEQNAYLAPSGQISENDLTLKVWEGYFI